MDSHQLPKEGLPQSITRGKFFLGARECDQGPFQKRQVFLRPGSAMEAFSSPHQGWTGPERVLTVKIGVRPIRIIQVKKEGD